jgi:hypothetical protein
MKKCMDKTKGNKKKSKTKQNKKSDGAEEGGCTVCDRIFRDFTASSTSYEVLRIDGFNFDDVSFNVSRLSYQTLFDMSIPYTSEEELENIGNAFDSIAITDVVDPEDYRRVLSIDMGSVLSGCEGDVYPILNLTFPESVQELCVGDMCRPVVCPLTLHETARVSNRLRDFSFAASNNPLFFGNNFDCTLVKPEFWDDYITTYFGADALNIDPPELLYYLDPDADGVSNIVEYYGVDPMNLTASAELVETLKSLDVTNRRRDFQLARSTDPTNFDTDGDLLNDGFEIRFGLDALNPDNLNSDEDGDGLTTFQEQRLGTNPFNADSDADGISDKTESDSGSDPNDGQDSTPNDKTVELTLSVGDPSGSASERYNMVVGTTTHEAPVFGQVRSDRYNFPPGVYTVSVLHVASKLSTPDYDYFAGITWTELPEGITVSVSNPQRLLGTHFESSFDFSVGKTATLTIEDECAPPQPGEEIDCSCHKTCEDCQSPSAPTCDWTQTDDSPTGFCRVKSTGQASRNNRKPCPCQKC